MAVKTSTIIASIAVALAIGTGGYFANEWRVCSGLEQDYLTTIGAIRRDADTDLRLAGYVGGTPSEELKQAWALREDLLDRQLARVYERCGIKAGDAATAKSEDILFAG